MASKLRAISWIAVSTKTQAADDRGSLDAQSRDNESIAKQNGWQIIDYLRVPGFSRAYIDIHECAREMSAEGIDAFTRLIRHWDNKDFDVLICADADRFARTQTLLSYVVERTINIGATIHSQKDGRVDASNFRIFISMAGYRAASERDMLRKRQQIGFDTRLKLGLPSSGLLPITHRFARDPRGKIKSVELDPTGCQILHDAAQLLLEGVAFQLIGSELYNRFGHVNPSTDRRFSGSHLRALFYHPFTWGINARRFYQRYGIWVIDETAPVPPGLIIERNPNPPIPAAFTGDLAEQVRAELLRRHQLIRGRTRPHRIFPFRGLLICDLCHSAMTSFRHRHYAPKYRCNAHYSFKQDRCPAIKMITEQAVQEYIDLLLKELLVAGTPDLLDHLNFRPVDHTPQLETLAREIAHLEQDRAQMIRNQARANEESQEAYQTEINLISERLAILRTSARDLGVLQKSEKPVQRSRAFEEIKEIGIQEFWLLPPTQINQLLHRLFGKYRLVVNNGIIRGLKL